MRFYRYISSLVLFSMLFIPYSVSSEDEEASGGVLEEIVVTARKREETAQSVPIPISALSEAQMEARNITDIQDLSLIHI